MASLENTIEALNIFKKVKPASDIFVGIQGCLCVAIKDKLLSDEDKLRLKELGWEHGGKEWYIPMGG